MASPLYLHISDNALTLARHTEEGLQMHTHRLNRRVSFTLNLREALAQTDEAITANADEVFVYATRPISTVPLSEFTEREAAALYATSFRNEPHHRILYDTLPTQQLACIYSLNETTCKAIEEAFPKVRYHNALTPVAERGKQQEGHTHSVIAYTHEDVTDALLWHDHRLLAVNSFTTRQADDAAFFVIGFLRALGVELSTTSIAVVGEPRRRQAVCQALSPFAEVAEEQATPISEDLPYALACAMLFRR